MLEIIYDEHFIEDMLHVPHLQQDRIKDVIEKKLRRYPELFGRKLRGKLKDYWKLRVGDYRIGIVVEEGTVEFVRCLSRRDLYKFFP